MKSDHLSSVFPVKLLMAYVVFVSADHLIFAIQISDPDYIGRWVDIWNSVLVWSLLLCVPLLGVILSAVWHFKRMPIFAVVMILASLWHIWKTLCFYFGIGLDPRFNLDMQPLNFFGNILFLAIPFVVVYLIRRFWAAQASRRLASPIAGG